jgi:hypothetical protein
MSGELYWWQKDTLEWTDMDDKLVTDLLMWGKLNEV